MNMNMKLSSSRWLIISLVFVGGLGLFLADRGDIPALQSLESFTSRIFNPTLPEPSLSAKPFQEVGEVSVLDPTETSSDSILAASFSNDVSTIQTAAVQKAALQANTEPCATQVNCATQGMPFTITAPQTGPVLESIIVGNVDSANWTTVSTSATYTSMVAVCSIQYVNNSLPAVVRMQNATSASFDIRLQNPSDVALSAETVNCIVAEEGVWALDDGRKLEAQKYVSTITDRNGSWLGQAQLYNQSYSNPVVIGQIMTHNDTNWSTFWSRGSSVVNPPSAASLFTGKHIGSDTNIIRLDETVGYIVIEAGHGLVDGVEYEASLSGDTIFGVANNGSGFNVNFTQSFSSAPIAGVVSQGAMDGSDGSWAYLVGANPFTVSSAKTAVDEDQIGDAERLHTNEQLGYFVTSNTSFIGLTDQGSSSEQVIGEVGYINDTLTHSLETVILSRTYIDPVVIIQPPSYDGNHQSVIRITDIQPDRFTVYVHEAPDQDGIHTHEAVSYIVLETGQWQLANGTKLEVDHFNTTTTVGPQVGYQWSQVNFASTFSGTPVVLSQVQTDNDPHWVKTRMASVDGSGFLVAFEEDQAQTTQHGSDTIGWVAIEAGSGDWNSNPYLAARVQQAVTQNWYQVNFGTTFGSAPRFLASLSSYFGSDPSYLRYSRPSLNVTGVQVRVEEDTTLDAEIGHIAESISYLVLENDGLLTGESVVSAASQLSVPKVVLVSDLKLGVDDSYMFDGIDFSGLLVGDDEEGIDLSAQDLGQDDVEENVLLESDSSNSSTFLPFIFK